MEPTIPAATKDAIAHLIQDEPLLSASLSELTSLNQVELDLFKATWISIDAIRRRQVVHRLVEMVEDNIELNFDAIFKFCLKDQDDEVRSLAIEGLWENEEPSRIEPLISLLEKDKSERVQTSAAIALGKFALMAEQNKIRHAYKDRLQKILLGIIDDQNRPIEVRRRALEAAAPLSLPEVKEAITDAYQSLDPRLKVSSIYAMGKSLDKTWLHTVLKELSRPDAELRYEACSACGEFEEAAAVTALAELVLQEKDADIRLAAIQALGKIGTAQAQNCLKQCLESRDEAIREAAEQALSEMETKDNPLSLLK